MTLAEVCVKRPVFSVMLIGFLVVLGIFSFRDLGVDLFPKADPATVFISVSLPGAQPEEMVTQVALPIEESLSTISGIDELRARITEGTATITVQFTLERGVEDAAQDVREKVAGAMRQLPPNVIPPVIQKADPDSEPVMTVAVASDRSLRETTEIADKRIRRILETVDGVGEVAMSGGRERQIRIYVDAEGLSAYGVTINEVENAVREENVESPGGRIIRGESEMGVRTMGRIDASSQFSDIIVKNVAGSPIRLRDIGKVEDDVQEPRTFASIERKPAVLLDIRRQSGTNTVKIIDAIRAKLKDIEKELPRGFAMRVTRDQSVFIRASIDSLEEHLLLGSLLASLVVWVFIRNLRSVFIAAVAIPTSVIATFTLMKALDFTLNNMTLLALTLAVGIVIDDAIVVLENIYRFVEEKGYDPFRAAIDGTKEIALAVMATTLSLVIIFAPIAFMTGYARRYVYQFGWTMAFSIIVSMLVSFTLTPMLSARLLKKKEEKEGGEKFVVPPSGETGLATESLPPEGGTTNKRHTSKESKLFLWIDRAYGWILELSLRHRVTFVILCLAVFAATFPLYSWIGRDWIPPDDQSELMVSLDLPEGSSLQTTADRIEELAERMKKEIKGVDFVVPQVPPEGRMNHSHTYIKLIDASQRKETNLDIANQIRKLMSEYKNMRYRVSIPSALGGGGEAQFYPIRGSLLGQNFDQVVDLAKLCNEEVKKAPGLVDVEPGLNLNNPEFQVKVDRQKASDLGVRVGDVARAVRLMFSGDDEISTYKEGDEQYMVTMQLLPDQRNNPEMLARLMVPSSKLGQTRLDNLATIERGAGPARIERLDRQFQVGLNANLKPGVSLDEGARQTMEAIGRVPMPEGYKFKFFGQVKQLEETTANLVITFLLASIFMYMVLAAQFESILHPLIIMLSLPLSIPFALFSLWATGRSLNLWSALGVLLLLGIVKKNAILQIDYTNQLRREGMPLREAIIRANHVRLRPILMTTFSIVAGLIPTAMGVGAGAAQRSAIAVTIIGGQTLCLLLTLLVTPVAYSLLAGLEGVSLFAKARAGLSAVKSGITKMFM
ncbi:MAG TPA: efflux RND transporter permease subunit [Blastocatellia bacterium]|nr:efflux RND transporter permease subunit [Blastocatellia bacterium]